MVTAAHKLTPAAIRPQATGLIAWFKEFLKQELAPYPGRTALVWRMTIAATVVMVLTMIFRIPYGAYGAIYALTISRENPQTTINAVKTVILAFAFSVVYLLIGAMLFLNDPNLRLFWVIGTMFVMFFSLSAMTNYAAAARFGYLLIITIPLWDRHIRTGLKVEGTLWAFAAISLGSLITVLVELAYRKLNPRDELLHPIADRLMVVEEALDSYAESRPLDKKLTDQITRYAMIGTSKLRTTLQRSGYAPQYREQMGAVVALVGRLVDLTANVIQLTFEQSDEGKKRIRSLAARIASIRRDLLGRTVPAPFEPGAETEGLQALPILREMERTVSLIPEAFAGLDALRVHDPPPLSGKASTRIFARDAFSNPEHIKFGLKGCFAASLCYILYSAKAWPGISTSVTTCFLTALTTIGSSRQKQVLRIMGAIVGGVIMGMGAQVFILPYLDSIGGFILLFIACTLVASWFATSSARLSYFGVQVAVAFYLINVSDFAVQTSLEPARDRVVGILLGLLMMWLVFDQLWGASAGTAMKTNFIAILRLLAQFSREPVSNDVKVAIERSYQLRDSISSKLDQVKSQADGVLFEFGPSRQRDLALRKRILACSPRLRMFFLSQIATWKYRAQLTGFELPKPIATAQREFDNNFALALEAVADRIEGRSTAEHSGLGDSMAGLERTVEAYRPEESQEVFAARFQALLSLDRRVQSLTSSLIEESLKSRRTVSSSSRRASLNDFVETPHD